MDINYHEQLTKGNKLFRAADHLAYVTYPFLKDNKLIIAITENLYNSMIYHLTALLQFEIYYKRLHEMPLDTLDKIRAFQEHCMHRYNFNARQIEIIKDLHNLMKERKSSIMEFCRNDKYIIYNNLEVKSISISTLRNYLFISKDFVRKINLIIQNAK